MSKEEREIIKLSAEKFIFSFFNLTLVPFFEASSIYKQSIKRYKESSEVEVSEINNRIAYLKRMKYIRIFSEGKERYAEITPKGKKYLEKVALDNMKISKPNKWDKKWRIVIFDIPEKYNNLRDVFRNKLYELGFVQVQKSVYVHPFPCSEDIAYLSRKLMIDKYVTLLISEIIQGEEKILARFIEKKILKKEDFA